MAKPDYLNVAPMSGSGDGELNLSVANPQNYTGRLDRTGVVTVSGGGISREVSVTCKAPFIAESMGTVSVPAQGGTVHIRYKLNRENFTSIFNLDIAGAVRGKVYLRKLDETIITELNISSGPRYDISSHTTDKAVILDVEYTIPANPTTSARYDEMTIEIDEGTIITCSIEQSAGSAYLNVSPLNVYFDAQGYVTNSQGTRVQPETTVAVVNVTSNVDWSVS